MCLLVYLRRVGSEPSNESDPSICGNYHRNVLDRLRWPCATSVSRMSEPLKAITTILIKGFLPPGVLMACTIYGLYVHSPLAWIPFVLTVSVSALILARRYRKEVQDELLMLQPFKLRPIEEVVDEYQCLLKRKH